MNTVGSLSSYSSVLQPQALVPRAQVNKVAARRHACVARAAAPRTAVQPEHPDWPTGSRRQMARKLGEGLLGKGLPGRLVRNFVGMPEFPGQGVSYYFSEDVQRPEMAKRLAAAIERHDTPLTLPPYFREPFHVWHGNENIFAALNGEAVMAMFNGRYLFDDDRAAAGSIAGARAMTVARTADILVACLGRGRATVQNIADLGCGTGRVTRLLAHEFEHSQVLGIDASAEALGWADLRATKPFCERELHPREVTDAQRVSFRRALAEDTGLPDASQDVVLLSYVTHELPLAARRDVLAECQRILKPGGVVAFVDHTQKGTMARRMYTLPFRPIVDVYAHFRSQGAPEPYEREFYTGLLADSLKEAGFVAVIEKPVTKMQSVVVGRKPD